MSLADPVSVNEKDDQGWTPVHLACAAVNSQIFYSHQALRRSSSVSWGSREDRYSSLKKPPRHYHYGLGGELYDAERTTAMGILEVLLRHTPHFGYDFPTPLHCAANSGWFSHAQALVEAGAHVYTGPICSPLCWVEGGASGNSRVAEYLRELLGQEGLSMIESDHLRAGHTLVPSVHPPQPTQRTQQHLPAVSPGTGPSASRLVLPVRGGYLHHLSMGLVRQWSAAGCSFCRIIWYVLGSYASVAEHKSSQVIIRLSNGNKGHKGICTEPPILRILELGLCSACKCPPKNQLRLRGSLGFSECFGGCGEVDVSVDVFAFKERKLTIPTVTIPIDLGQRPESYASNLSWTIPRGMFSISPYPLASTVVDIVHQWLHACQNTHNHCRLASALEPGELPLLPDRVIDVGHVGMDTVRLHTNRPGKRGQYLALSHRWVTGPTPAWVTTRRNLGLRHNWFPFRSLASTIVDAIIVTRSLGFRFLWIDSLCILQDLVDDWKVQSAQMATIYANADLTLFADCAKDDQAGFLRKRYVTPSTAVTLPVLGEEEPLTLHLRGNSYEGFDGSLASQFSNNVETGTSAYLSDRGWILQERVLSRRILHFGSDQLFWECHEGTFAENGYTVMRRGIRECGITDNDSRFSKLTYSRALEATQPDRQQVLPPAEFTSLWKRLVTRYCALKLTRGEDKLPALSGLAAAFQARTEPENTYISGLWEKGLATYLAWSITTSEPADVHRVFQGHVDEKGRDYGSRETDFTFVHESQLSARPKAYRAPSFSWASIDGLIEFHDVGTSSTLRVDEVGIEPRNPYGRPDQGWVYVDLTSPVCRAWSCGPFQEDTNSTICPRRKGYTPLYCVDSFFDSGLPFGYLLPDAVEPATQEKREVYCLNLGSVFLVLVPYQEEGVSDGESAAILPVFRRIGLGGMRCEEGKHVDVFANARDMTIRIV
ncbi:heterokaryon incompatibility protein-domain-containing protein [Podospora didyma]|uniref:Heterokaryon incompatibility protein-domain-containing protein n=1 Tax=Podospora didyma TaxID=330526 RepID=A0AAE0NRY3_9PEZI|nr:heterokaryon incompatibility protein-domain-containing protein [Podospora didyma]